jgi:sec-independent protein translocase protein TatB
MLDLAWSEIALILLVALVVIGPKELPNAIRGVAEFIRKARQMASEFQVHVDEMMRESKLDEVKKQIDEVRTGIYDVKRDVERSIDEHGLRDAFKDPFVDTPAPPPAAATEAMAGATPAAAPPPAPAEEPRLAEAPPGSVAPAFVPPAFVPPGTAAPAAAPQPALAASREQA